MGTRSNGSAKRALRSSLGPEGPFRLIRPYDSNPLLNHMLLWILLDCFTSADRVGVLGPRALAAETHTDRDLPVSQKASKTPSLATATPQESSVL